MLRKKEKVAAPPLTPVRAVHVQRRAIESNEPAPVPGVVGEALRSSGHPLDPTTRGLMESRFGYDFSRVRVHADGRAAEAAAALSAQAFTVGPDIVFGGGYFQPGSATGQKLIAHELVHVAQQQSATAPPTSGVSQPGDAAEREADRVAGGLTDGHAVTAPRPALSSRPSAAIQRLAIEPAPTAGLGTAKTTAPVATTSPQRQMNETLDRELILIAKARLLIPWIDAHAFGTIKLDDLFADAKLMAQLDLSNDKALRARILPFDEQTPPKKTAQLFTTDAALAPLLQPPKNKEALWPILDLLHYYGVILLLPGRDAFGPPDIMAGLTRKEANIDRGRFDQQTAAIEQFAVKFKKEVADRNNPKRVAPLEEIPTAWATTSEPGKAKHRRFAKPVAALLGRLRKRNDKWRATTYPAHFWNEFSVDMFLGVGVNKEGFYNRGSVRDFFKALNEACEEDSPPGKFAWKAIYNDEGLAKEMNELYGERRVLFDVPGHGPGPDMHVHLDLRPFDVPTDTAGFYMDADRVVLSPPPVRPAVPPMSPPVKAEP
ncbi:MAG TPA: DUF4157 domain-containing protein [Blastocatellia bacterium]|nr:DUF4157 domain-containing protein [Blastocatellia bacterium]